MPSTLIDSIFLKDLYGTPEMRAVFDDLSVEQKWLDAEVALAQAEAELGVIPAYAAVEIARKARADQLDNAKMKALIDKTVHPIVPLIRVLKDRCEGDAGEYIHWGATTQDIMDTGLALQAKEAIAIFEPRLAGLEEALADLATKHRDTPMAGRTHGQQALPITFGFKIAVWLAEIDRHRQRLSECKPRVLVGQFAGAAGTLASVEEHGLQIQEGMLKRLGLGVPLIAWHTARDGLAEFTHVLAMIATTCGKIANEVINLQRTEIAEVEESFTEGKVGSSTMPHKRNPMMCEAIVALAKLVARLAPAALDGMFQEHERDWSCDHIEWAYLPDLCIMTDGALSLMVRVVRGLRVYPDRMRKNLDALDGLMLSEAVMFALAERVGRQTAHDVVYECAMRSVEVGAPFRDVLMQHEVVAVHLSSVDIDLLLDPARYLGLATQFVDRTLRATALSRELRN